VNSITPVIRLLVPAGVGTAALGAQSQLCDIPIAGAKVVNRSGSPSFYGAGSFTPTEKVVELAKVVGRQGGLACPAEGYGRIAICMSPFRGAGILA
jgi:hypothetical protein